VYYPIYHHMTSVRLLQMIGFAVFQLN